MGLPRINRLSDAFMAEVEVANHVLRDPGGVFAHAASTYDALDLSVSRLKANGSIDAQGNVVDAVVRVQDNVNLRAKAKAIVAAFKMVDWLRKQEEQKKAAAAAAAKALAEQQAQAAAAARYSGNRNDVHTPADLAGKTDIDTSSPANRISAETGPAPSGVPTDPFAANRSKIANDVIPPTMGGGMAGLTGLPTPVLLAGGAVVAIALFAALR